MFSYAAALRPHTNMGVIIVMVIINIVITHGHIRFATPPRDLSGGIGREREWVFFHVGVDVAVVVSVLSRGLPSSFAFPAPLSNLCYVAVVWPAMTSSDRLCPA